MTNESNELISLSSEELTHATGGHVAGSYTFSHKQLRQSGFKSLDSYRRHLHYMGMDQVAPFRQPVAPFGR